jgi:hypothetical protein
VSGEVVLIDGAGGGVSRLVRTAAAVFAERGPASAALVGGLAVTIRLATVHRATNDVDAVTKGEHEGGVFLQYVRESDSAESRTELDGVTIDLMPTWPIDEAALPDDPLARLFVVGHRWALETATRISVHVAAGGGDIVHSSQLRVATAPALVACKLHAISDRRDARAAKRESDAVDLIRLVGDLVREPAMVAPLVDAPFGLPKLVNTQLERWFVAEPQRLARLARLGGALDAPDRDTIETLGTMFVSTLEGAAP